LSKAKAEAFVAANPGTSHTEEKNAYGKVIGHKVHSEHSPDTKEYFLHQKALFAYKGRDVTKPLAGDYKHGLVKKSSTTNTEVTSVTNHKRTLLTKIASLLGFRVSAVTNAKKVKSEDDHEEPDTDDMGGPSDDDEDNVTDNGGPGQVDNCGGEGGTPGPCASGVDKKHGSGPHPGNGKSRSEIASALSTETRQKYGQKNLDTRGHTQAAEAHENAVGIHQEAAKEQSKLGNYQKATTHTIAAKNHAFSAKKHRAWEKSGKTGSIASGKPIGNNSSNGDDMDRNKLVSWLTTNCDCHKGKDKVLANKDNYSDEELLKLKTNAETAMKNATLVANASMDNPDEEPDENDDDADEEQESNKTGKKGFKGPPMTKNMTLAEFEKNMPVAAQAIWNAAKEVEQTERQRLTSVITANISDVARKQVLTNKLMDRNKTTLEDLRDLASAIPQRQVRNQQAVIPNFFGNQPGTQFQAQTNNSGQDDLLDLPTINYADLAKSGDVRDRA